MQGMDWTRVLNLNIDVISGVNAALFLALFGSILAFLLGISTLRRGLKLVYFRKRQEAIARGWKLIIMSIVLAGASWALNNYAEPAFYTVFPPSPTITLTPTITETATITLPPTMTLSPTVSETPSITNTPALPDSLRAMATSQVDPGTEVLFSPIQFAEEIGDDGFPIEPSVRFMNPLRKLNGFYSYDKLVLGTQISFVWMRLDDRVALCESTVVWDISTGGYNFVTCEPEDPDDWLPDEGLHFLDRNFASVAARPGFLAEPFFHFVEDSQVLEPLRVHGEVASRLRPALPMRGRVLVLRGGGAIRALHARRVGSAEVGMSEDMCKHRRADRKSTR